ASPAGLTTEFQAGDHIYGLILPGKSWRDLYGAGDKTELGVMVGMTAGDNDDYQYITLKKPQYIDADSLVLEIAPDPAKMTSYKDPDMLFGEGKGNRKANRLSKLHVGVSRWIIFGRPRQDIFAVHPEYGKTWSYPIWLD
ncbi:MAG TPA: hypothetical protein PLS45_09290, partial [Bacillota bacterium]|nr:hypothetical protein [Bacillota bacterium]